MSGLRIFSHTIVVLLLVVRGALAQDFAATLQRGIDLQSAGRFAEALAAYEAALRLADFKNPNWEVAVSNLAVMYSHFDRGNDAQALLEHLLSVQQQQLGAEHQRVGQTLGTLGFIYFEQQAYDKALDALLRAFYISGRYEPLESPRMQRTLGMLCLAGSMCGSSVRTERLNEILELLIERVGPSDARIGPVLSALASIAVETGRYRDAEQYIERMKQLKPIADRRFVDWTNSLPAELANLYHRMGRYPEALEQTELVGKMLPTSTNSPSRLQRSVYVHWASKGEILLAMGQVREAVHWLEAALQGRDETGDANTVANVVSLGQAYEQLGELDRAEAMYDRARSDTHARTGNRVSASNHLAKLWCQRGKFDDAEQLLLDGIRHCEKHQILQSAFCAEVRVQLGDLYLAAGRYDEAIREFQTAIAVYEQLEGRQAQPQAAACLGLARALAAGHHVDESIAAADRARRHLHEFSVHTLPGLPEPQQREFLDSQEHPALAQAIEIVRKYPTTTSVRHSAEWLLNCKGQGQHALAQRMLLAREADDPSLAALVDDWFGVTGELARIAASDLPTQPKVLAELTQREQELARRLGDAQLRQQIEVPWVTVSAVRGALKPSSVLVELSLHAPPQSDAKPVYLAWIIPPAGDGEIAMFDLGSAAAIDGAIADLRAALAAIATTAMTKGLTIGETAADRLSASQAFDSAARRIADLVLRPMLPVLSRHEHWIVSPDRAMWLLPWSALPLQTSDGQPPRCVVERHRVTTLVSGRELLAVDAPVSGNPALVLADPDYDRTELPESGLQDFVQRPAVLRAFNGQARGVVPHDWVRLPGTATEALTVAPALEAYTHVPPRILTGAAAIEDEAKNAWRPRIAMFSTHGFLLDDSSNAEAAQNPLLNCGLVLAGANRSELRSRPRVEDGILTGLDILGTDLRGTELVVLSACETGLGQLNAGEGVAGLRQAFQLAGARAVMATLWRIPDAETAELMARFFDRLQAGDDKATALQRAQQSFLEDRDAAKAHPFFWAAFTLTGDWRSAQAGPPTQRPPRHALAPHVEVIVDLARVMDSTTVVATLVRGQRVARGRTNGEYVEVFYQPGSKRSAWVHRSAVRDAP
ncbi:MAG TPA: CHAT domain-containing protein [Pirellulales bacterium]|nr:CHAT domain-containing protein [Pirellulales bacterium]